jgi:uncharacterized surface protein with fasciclin (FAS1) repeats
MNRIKSLFAAAALSLAAVAAQAGDYGMKAGKTIVDVAGQAGSFSTLLTAVEAAGLTETLKGEGPFTVFAPTDAAFAALPEGTLESLLADRDALTSVLTYHVVAGKVTASEVAAMSPLESLQGSTLTVSTDGGVSIEEAGVVQADVMADNGVIHVIDTVLVP